MSSLSPAMLFAARSSALRLAQNQCRSTLTFTRQQQTPFARLLSSLAILEHRDGKLQNASLSAVTAAHKLGGSITGFIAGSGAKSVAEEAAKVKGLDKVIMIDDGSYDKVHIMGTLDIYRLAKLSTGSPRKLRSLARREYQ